MKKLTHHYILPLLFVTAISCEHVFQEEPGEDPTALFENLWETYQGEYAPFHQRKVDWGKQYEVFRPRVDPYTTDDELFGIMGELLATLDDGHVSLVAPDREVFFSNAVRREKMYDGLFDLSLIRESYLEPGYRSGEEDAFIYGKVRNENIGYIFFDYVGENFYAMGDFLDDFGAMDGYIVDMRHNKGGDFTYCFAAMGRLTDRERLVFRSKTKNGPGSDDFTEWTEWLISPSGDYVNKPIAILADRYTISAGERGIMAFMTLPNVAVVGDTTNGAHGTMIGRELANGWYFTLVPQIVEFADGQSYEGTGLPPDYFVRNRQQDVEGGIDSTLLVSISWIRSINQ